MHAAPSPVRRSGPFSKRGIRAWLGATRAQAALEVAILALPMFAFILFIFEISYDLFAQEALDSALHQAVRAIQTGRAQNVLNGNDFVNRYMCPSMGGLLACGTNVHIRVQKFLFGSNQDYYTVPNGAKGIVPLTGNVVNLTGYGSADFCNSAPGQVTLVSALYLGPTFLGGLLPGLLSVHAPSGSLVHATFSTTGLVTEDYTPTPAAAGTTPAPGC